jgi:hypothetical protein
MTVSSELNRKEYAGNGATTAFATSPVVFFDEGDLEVYVVVDATGVATLKTITTHYTVSGGAGAVGTVTMLTAPATGETLVIVRNLDIVQAVDLVNNDSSDAEVIEDSLDKLTMMAQQLNAAVDRSFKLADSDVSGASTEIPAPTASKLIGWDSTGLALENKTPADISLVAITAFIETLIDDADAATARTTLDVPSNAEAVLDTIIDAKGDLIVGTAADTPARKAVGTNGMALVADSSQSDGLLWAALAVQPGGRLTLTTAVPVTTADVTGATTVHYSPYKHNVVLVYDGSGWIPKTFSELSQATTDDTKSPAAVAASKNYDVFVWNDSGTMRATRGPTWDSGAVAGSDTARGTGAGSTELELFEGRYVNKNDITNGPVARRGLYVGTIRSDASSQINDSMALRHVWNCHNRVLRPMRVLEATNSWAYATNTIRQANGSTANRLDMVIGLSEDRVEAHVQGTMTNTSAGQDQSGALIGVDSTTAMTSGVINGFQVVSGASDFVVCAASWRGFPGIGRHFIAWLERGSGAGTNTFYGDNGVPQYSQGGIHGEMLA